MSTMKNKEEMGLLDLTNDQLSQVTGGCGHNSWGGNNWDNDNWNHSWKRGGWWGGNSETSISVDLNVSVDISSHSNRGW